MCYWHFSTLRYSCIHFVYFQVLFITKILPYLGYCQVSASWQFFREMSPKVLVCKFYNSKKFKRFVLEIVFPKFTLSVQSQIFSIWDFILISSQHRFYLIWPKTQFFHSWRNLNGFSTDDSYSVWHKSFLLANSSIALHPQIFKSSWCCPKPFIPCL